MRQAYGWAVGLLLFSTQAQAAIDCKVPRQASRAATNALQLAPIADELAATGVAPGGAGFATLVDERITVEEVVTRLHRQTCSAAPAVANLPKPGDPGAYQPKTASDNTPWRFDMTQNGKRMTADEFDAWMKARGVRVVKGPAAAAAPAPPPPAPAPAPTPPKKKKR
ncbi:MAG: hypothetical protein IT473_15950 [Lysobacter sp.]|nr:hypothetical protein [Lysobacter sp.]